MKRGLSFLLILLASLCLSAQNTVNVKFKGQIRSTEEYARLDSIRICDRTHQWQRTIVYPDTMLVANLTNMECQKENAIFLSQNTPNPFDGITEVELSISKDENVTMQIFDMLGKSYAQVSQRLSAGTHRFEIRLVTPQMYVLTANAEEKFSSIKISNTGNGATNSIVEIGSTLSSKLDVSDIFYIGDIMEYNGYTTYHGDVLSSDTIWRVQTSSEDITLHFKATPCPDVPVYSEIEITSCSDYYIYNDIRYEESGRYYQTLTAANGCDSMVLLLLNLHEGFTDERDGNSYCTVTIGDQTWMAENLRYIPAVNESDDWNSNAPRYYVYGYSGTDVEAAKHTINYSEYGVLYNWTAAMNGASSSNANPSGVQGICPNGWHMPSDAEWTELEIYLENHGYNFDEYVDTDNDRETHNVIAKSMAATSGWRDSDIDLTPGWEQSKNNSSKFNGKPGGLISYPMTNGINSIHVFAGWWTTSENPAIDGHKFDRYIHATRPYLNRTSNHNYYGWAVRCVQD